MWDDNQCEQVVFGRFELTVTSTCSVLMSSVDFVDHLLEIRQEVSEYEISEN